MLYRLLRNPLILPLLFFAAALSLIVVLAGGAEIKDALDDKLGPGGTYTFGLTVLVSPLIALTAWFLQRRGGGWNRFWSNYLRLVADILLGAGLMALAYLHATYRENTVGYQLTGVYILFAVAVYVVWVIASDILRIVEETPRVRDEVTRR